MARVYQLCAGQWRMGMSGPVALDICAAQAAMDICQVSPRARELYLRRIQIMDAEHRKAVREKQADEAKRRGHSHTG